MVLNMSNFVTENQMKEILHDPKKTGNYLSLKNKTWTCLKKDNNEIKLKKTLSIIEATMFFRGIAQ